MILYIWVKSKAFKQCLFCFWFCPPETIVHQKNACLPLNSHHSRLNGFVENQLHLPIICCRDSLGQQRVIRVLEMRIMISGPAPRSTVCILIMQRPKISTTYFLQQFSPNSEPGNVWLHISTSNTLMWFVTFFMCIEYNVVLSFLSVQGKHSVNLAEKNNKDNDTNYEKKGDHRSNGNLGWRLIVVIQQDQVTRRLLFTPTTLRKQLFSCQQR